MVRLRATPCRVRPVCAEDVLKAGEVSSHRVAVHVPERRIDFEPETGTDRLFPWVAQDLILQVGLRGRGVCV